MAYPYSLGSISRNWSFPGNWSFQGDATLIIGDYNRRILISLQLIFVEGAEIDVKLIWEGVSIEECFRIATKMRTFKHQILIIQNSVILVGFSFPPLNMNNEITDFNVTRLVTYSSFSQGDALYKNLNYFVQLRVYLNDDYSVDDTWGTEFENIPQQRNRAISKKERLSLYCALNSGYEVKCGKKYVIHQDHNVLRSKNIESLYRLSFIDVSISQSTQFKVEAGDEKHNGEAFLLQHLETLIEDACGFLSIICNYEILPIYYDYTIYSQNNCIYGQIIPIWNRRKISQISKSWPHQEILLFHNATSFFECCPIPKKISRGIQHLKLTVLDATPELKLLAACSAIEYFYSYWFWEMHGLSKLIQAIQEKNDLAFIDKNEFKRLVKLQNDQSGNTPYLSRVIRFFLNEIGVDWKKYIDGSDTPHFIQIRNELLHGSFISDDSVLYVAEDNAQKLGAEILFMIMKLVSKANDLKSYEKLPRRSPEQSFYTIPKGYVELKNAFDDLCRGSDKGIFWN